MHIGSLCCDSVLLLQRGSDRSVQEKMASTRIFPTAREQLHSNTSIGKHHVVLSVFFTGVADLCDGENI